jgi:uncharacterized protein YbaR (Trm112 family)
MTRSDPERSTSPIVSCPRCRTFLSISADADGRVPTEGARLTCDCCGHEFQLSEDLLVRKAEAI